MFFADKHCLNCVLFNCRAGKPLPGLHLDVMKDSRMIQVCWFDTNENIMTLKYGRTTLFLS